MGNHAFALSHSGKGGTHIACVIDFIPALCPEIKLLLTGGRHVILSVRKTTVQLAFLLHKSANRCFSSIRSWW